jgi:hypothetical protein
VIINYEAYQRYKQLQTVARQRQAIVERLSRIAEEVSQRTASLSEAEIGDLVDEAISASRQS